MEKLYRITVIMDNETIRKSYYTLGVAMQTINVLKQEKKDHFIAASLEYREFKSYKTLKVLK
jgi:hypothetical protein